MNLSIPSHVDLMFPVLEALQALGGSGTNAEIDEWVIRHEAFTDNQLHVLHNGGPQTKLAYRLHWARSYCKAIHAADNSSRGVWAITPLGSRLSPDEIRERVRELQRQQAMRRRPSITPERDDNESDELDWQDQLLRRLVSLTPEGFERLAQRLLREAGFVNVDVLGRSGDGGIDGVGVYRLSLVSFPVFFQCKRYKGSVGSREIRDFRGAMAGRGEKGLLITTGRFTPEAVAEATRDGAPPVELIDGTRLCELMYQYRLGVRVQERIEYDTTIDEAFFTSFSEGHDQYG
jgi:restriction system protein